MGSDYLSRRRRCWPTAAVILLLVVAGLVVGFFAAAVLTTVLGSRGSTEAKPEPLDPLPTVPQICRTQPSLQEDAFWRFDLLDSDKALLSELHRWGYPLDKLPSPAAARAPETCPVEYVVYDDTRPLGYELLSIDDEDRVPLMGSPGLSREGLTQTKHKLAIIVPFRGWDSSSEEGSGDRGGTMTSCGQLRLFLSYMRRFLRDTDLDYEIVVVEQAPPSSLDVTETPFNRGMMLNIGVELANPDADYFVFHDVDTLPLSSKNSYEYFPYPLQRAAPTSLGGQYEDESYIGGVLQVPAWTYVDMNGFSNAFWGRGAENNDDFFLRLRAREAAIAQRRQHRHLSGKESAGVDDVRVVLARVREEEARQWSIPHETQGSGFESENSEILRSRLLIGRSSHEGYLSLLQRDSFTLVRQDPFTTQKWGDSRIRTFAVQTTISKASTRNHEPVFEQRRRDPTPCVGGQPCYHGGVCLGPGDCFCLLDKYDSTCGMNRTIPSTNCPAVGNCSSDTGKGMCFWSTWCDCAAGWSGTDCSTPLPPASLTTCGGVSSNESAACGTHGICVNLDRCLCFTDWTGSLCQYPQLGFECWNMSADYWDVCSSRGVCVAQDDCRCNEPENWAGPECNMPICDGEVAGTPGACSNHGDCTAPENCLCTNTSEYDGEWCDVPLCKGIQAGNPGVCSNHGNCTAAGVCTCTNTSEYDGEWCEIPTCDGKLAGTAGVCSDHGACTAFQTCACTNASEFLGEWCEVHVCDGEPAGTPGVCSGHGVCTALGICSCTNASEYDGDFCEIPLCDGKRAGTAGVCSDHGTCTSFGGCVCTNTSENDGEWCEIPLCDGKHAGTPGVCSDHGICASFGVCVCTNTSRFVGEWCEVPVCDGKGLGTPGVCSDHGTCAAGVCTCTNTSEYDGEWCEIPLCDGKLAGTAGVCSDHGACTSFGVCICTNTSDYDGEWCEVPSCDGKPAGTPGVCSDHGVCSASGICTCTNASEYVGEFCDIPLCYGLPAGTPGVCSDHGACTSFGICQCESTAWLGADCGIPSLSCTPTCSQHGMCSSVCTCQTGWTSADCSLAASLDVEEEGGNGGAIGAGVGVGVSLTIVLVVIFVVVAILVVYFVTRGRRNTSKSKGPTDVDAVVAMEMRTAGDLGKQQQAGEDAKEPKKDELALQKTDGPVKKTSEGRKVAVAGQKGTVVAVGSPPAVSAVPVATSVIPPPAEAASDPQLKAFLTDIHLEHCLATFEKKGVSYPDLARFLLLEEIVPKMESRMRLLKAIRERFGEKKEGGVE